MKQVLAISALSKLRDSTESSLRVHEDQLVEVTKELEVRKVAYEQYKDFPDTVRTWIKEDTEMLTQINSELLVLHKMWGIHELATVNNEAV